MNRGYLMYKMIVMVQDGLYQKRTPGRAECSYYIGVEGEVSEG